MGMNAGMTAGMTAGTWWPPWMRAPPKRSLYLSEYFELAACSVISVICSVTQW